jgi:hypothetical protein
MLDYNVKVSRMTTETRNLKAELERVIEMSTNWEAPSSLSTFRDGVFAEALLDLVTRMARIEVRLLKGDTLDED